MKINIDTCGDWIGELNKIADDPNIDNFEYLKENFIKEGFSIFEKFCYPKYAARIFLFYQYKGIDALVNIFFQEDLKPKYCTAILGTLYFTSKKQYLNPGVPVNDRFRLKNPPISDELSKYAYKKLFDVTTMSLEHIDHFHQIISFLYLSPSLSQDDFDGTLLITEIFSLLRDSSLKINGQIIQEFNKILKDNLKEELYQKFLKKNPVLIDPLAKQILPKYKLGDDYITDFVVKKINDEYLLVEIEKPGDKIFTNNNDFSSQFSHALGQVIDFQEWVESNIAYARTKMPNISSPIGIIIMGRDDDLNEIQKKKLRRLLINMNGKVKVFTYDDILNNANKLLNNIISNSY